MARALDGHTPQDIPRRHVPQLTPIDKRGPTGFSLPLAAMIDSSTDLARERSLEAANGTLLAWIRTVLALIGFGFGVGKFYGYLHDAGLQERLDPIRSTLSFGASFIVLRS